MDRRWRTVIIVVIAAGAVAAGWALHERGDDDDDERTESTERQERKAPSPPASQASADAQEKIAALAERMGQIGVADRGNCGKLAADLRKLADEQKPPLLETSPRAKPPDTADDEQFMSDRGLDGAHATRVQAARAQMQPSLDGCKGDPDVAGAMKALTR